MSGLDNLIRTFFDLGEMSNVFPMLITVGLPGAPGRAERERESHGARGHVAMTLDWQ